MRTCKKCGEEQSLDEFWSNGKGGKMHRCRACKSEEQRAYTRRRREANRRYYHNHKKKNPQYARQKWLRRYGLTEESFRNLLESQNGKCAICCQVLDSRANVDHDHACCPGERSCGQCVRGLLCGNHNRGLGMFSDSVDLLQAAIDYLNRWKCQAAKSVKPD